MKAIIFITLFLASICYANEPKIGDSATYDFNGMPYTLTVVGYDADLNKYDIHFKSTAQESDGKLNKDSVLADFIIASCGDFENDKIETITVPAGSFKTCRSVMTIPTGGKLMTITSWRADGIPFVKIKELREVDGKSESIELISYHRN